MNHRIDLLDQVGRIVRNRRQHGSPAEASEALIIEEFLGFRRTAASKPVAHFGASDASRIEIRRKLYTLLDDIGKDPRLTAASEELKSVMMGEISSIEEVAEPMAATPNKKNS